MQENLKNKAVSRQKTGKLGELIALNYLLIKGYEVVEQNYRVGSRELDLLMREGRLLVVVEVKTNKDELLVQEGQRLGRQQRIHLRKAAGQFIGNNAWVEEVRFDVVWIRWGKSGMELRHVTDAFYII